jgi:hypothetical protein
MRTTAGRLAWALCALLAVFVAGCAQQGVTDPPVVVVQANGG